jgi:hypothetical protein
MQIRLENLVKCFKDLWRRSRHAFHDETEFDQSSEYQEATLYLCFAGPCYVLHAKSIMIAQCYMYAKHQQRTLPASPRSLLLAHKEDYHKAARSLLGAHGKMYATTPTLAA